MKKILMALMTAIFVLGGTSSMAQNVEASSSSKPTTIFLHGYYGAETSMIPIIRHVSGVKSKKTVLVPYEMTRNGKKNIYTKNIPYAGQKTTYFFTPPGYKGSTEMRIVDFSKHGEKNTNDKLVHIVFSQNTQSLDSQEKMLRKVLADLQKKKVKEINIVAHSMGGNLATQLLLKGSPIKVKNLVTLDSPIFGAQKVSIGGSSRDLWDGGAYIKESLAKKKKISSHTKVLSYTDTFNKKDVYTWTVLEASAKGLAKFTTSKQFTFKKVSGNHLTIITNKTVLDDVKRIAK